MQTFRGWLRSHIKEDTPIGDLARDALSDKDWKGRSVDSLYSHLRYTFPEPCLGAWGALAEAAFQYTGDASYLGKDDDDEDYPEESMDLTFESREPVYSWP